MGTPASFVVTADNVYWHVSDSDSEIRRRYDIRENRPPDVRTVSVQITPPEWQRYDLPLGEWVCRVWQHALPIWYDLKGIEARCRRALSEWAKARLVLPGQTRDCYDGDRLIVCGGRVNNVHQGGVVESVLQGGVVRTVLEGGTVCNVGRDGVVWNVRDGGIVQTVEAGGTVGRVDDGVLRAVLPGGTVERVAGNGVVMHCAGAVDVAQDCALVRIHGGGIVRNAHNDATVIACGKWTGAVLKSKRSVMVHRTESGIDISTGRVGNIVLYEDSNAPV